MSSGLFLPALLLQFAAAASPAQAARRPPLNIVLIGLNALRADHLKIYGYGKETAPGLSRLAAEGIVFEQAVAQSHWTLPSLASLFTSKYVHSHGLYDRSRRLSESEAVLAEALKEGGYKTAAFTGGLDMSGAYGLKRGFDIYYDDTGGRPMGSFRELTPKALKWLAGRRKDRFFMFLDSYDIHPPFDKPSPDGNAPDYSGALKGASLDYALLGSYRNGAMDGGKIKLTKADLAYINFRYDNGIACADGFLGEFIAGLAELGLSENTALVVFSEHGEELGDHGSFDRFGSGNLYDEAIRVPLIMVLPGRSLKGARVQAQVRLIDLMPTILELAGLRAGPQAQGKSLLPLLDGAGRDPGLYAYSEAGPGKWALRSREWKLIYNNGDYSLFDLINDRTESVNAAAKEPETVYTLAQKLMEWRRKTRTALSPGGARPALTGEMKRKLKEAGYWVE
ncbi:MAG: sulfatase [Elusimicrobiales bacterium]|jgi:arylsulfatase A-like enzyme